MSAAGLAHLRCLALQLEAARANVSAVAVSLAEEAPERVLLAAASASIDAAEASLQSLFPVSDPPEGAGADEQPPGPRAFGS